MAVDTTAPDALAESAAQSQADPTEATPADAPETLSLDEARKLRSEAANLRRRKHELETQLRQFQDSGLSELDKAQKRIAELETQVQAAETAKRAHAVERLLKDAHYPDLLLAKVDLATIELDDAGNIHRGDAIVRDLQARYPHLWARTTGSGDGGAASAGSLDSADMNQWLRRHLGR